MVLRSRSEHRTAPPSNAYLTLLVSQRKNRSRHFPDGKLIFDRASSVHSSLRSLQWGHVTFRFALPEATEDNTPLLADLVGDILELNEHMEKVPAGYRTPWAKYQGVLGRLRQ